MTRRQPKVFISHSHEDRRVATALQAVLEKHSGQTYLDQDRIRAGDVLPDRIRIGIEWCEFLLLIWSARSARSPWVNKEWNLAHELRKKIIPYLLDDTALPADLEDRVYVEREDKNRAHAKLLRSIFGKDFRPPDPKELFPGKWKAVPSSPVGQATYDLELRANGQISGTGEINQVGMMTMLEGIFRSEGLINPLASRISVEGSWSYDQQGQVLTLDVTAEMFGHSNRETIYIHAKGNERGAIQGRDSQGLTWTLRRTG